MQERSVQSLIERFNSFQHSPNENNNKLVRTSSDRRLNSRHSTSLSFSDVDDALWKRKSCSPSLDMRIKDFEYELYDSSIEEQQSNNKITLKKEEVNEGPLTKDLEETKQEEFTEEKEKSKEEIKTSNDLKDVDVNDIETFEDILDDSSETPSPPTPEVEEEFNAESVVESTLASNFSQYQYYREEPEEALDDFTSEAKKENKAIEENDEGKHTDESMCDIDVSESIDDIMLEIESESSSEEEEQNCTNEITTSDPKDTEEISKPSIQVTDHSIPPPPSTISLNNNNNTDNNGSQFKPKQTPFLNPSYASLNVKSTTSTPKDFFSTLFKRPEKEFGMDLLTVMNRKSEKGHDIPSLIEEMMQIVQEKVHVEGLFRVGGNVKDIENLMKKIDSGKKVDLRSQNIHNITAMVKKYIRHVGLIPKTAYALFQEIGIKDNEEEMVNSLKELFRDVNVIPFYNALLLNRVLQLLYHIHCHNDENCMNADNLAICFAPNLFQEEQTNLLSLQNQSRAVKMISVMIKRYEDFKPLFDKIKKNKEWRPRRQSMCVHDFEIIKQGFLWKLGSTKLSWKKRFCILTQQQEILIFNSNVNVSKKSIKGIIKLNGYSRIEEITKKPLCFSLIQIPENLFEEKQTIATLKAETVVEKEQWESALESIIDKLCLSEVVEEKKDTTEEKNN
ncbi:hypothetical protein ABK040_000042 [Willaertia magna]